MTPRAKFDLSLLPERPDLAFEQRLWGRDVRRVAGVDEAGRGALAGPVAAGVVILPWNRADLMARLDGVRDSKEMQPEARDHWSAVIKDLALDCGVGLASCQEIDRIGIVPATCLAISRALEQIQQTPDHLLVDYLQIPDVTIPQTPLVKGDARSLSIACASILAKTTRDALLVEMDGRFPGYDLAANKGYATAGHRRAIDALGPCAIHRRSFSPIAAYDSLFPPDGTDPSRG
jgi:ribonuclease HII